MAANLRAINDCLIALAGHILGDTFTHVQASATRDSAGVTVLHTVTTGMVLKLTDAVIITQSIASGQYGRLYVRTPAPADVIDIFRAFGSASNISSNANRAFPRPFSVLSGQQICIETSAAGHIFGSITGFEMRED
jgi:hypothetical protein